MKTIILCTLLVTIYLFLEVRGNCYYEGRNLTVGEHTIDCNYYECNADGTIFGKPCPLTTCVGKPLGYREVDLSKPYPQCCPVPICKM
ncbi:hypothetical protein ANTPLA_LOCUS1575 [Anthophora plagiata]